MKNDKHEKLLSAVCTEDWIEGAPHTFARNAAAYARRRRRMKKAGFVLAVTALVVSAGWLWRPATVEQHDLSPGAPLAYEIVSDIELLLLVEDRPLLLVQNESGFRQIIAYDL